MLLATRMALVAPNERYEHCCLEICAHEVVDTRPLFAWLRSTVIGRDLRAPPNTAAYHLFLRYTDERGLRWACGGHPERKPTRNRDQLGLALSRAGGSFGAIVVEYGPYEPGTLEYRADTIAVTIETGWAAHDAARRIRTAAEQINNAKAIYLLWGPNSNTVARLLLAAAGLPLLQPVALAPGFDHTALHHPRSAE